DMFVWLVRRDKDIELVRRDGGCSHDAVVAQVTVFEAHGLPLLHRNDTGEEEHVALIHDHGRGLSSPRLGRGVCEDCHDISQSPGPWIDHEITVFNHPSIGGGDLLRRRHDSREEDPSLKSAWRSPGDADSRRTRTPGRPRRLLATAPGTSS